MGWSAGDCFEFVFQDISDYSDDEFGIDYSPVREDISCDGLSIAAECSYVSGQRFIITMLEDAEDVCDAEDSDDEPCLIGPFNNPPS